MIKNTLLVFAVGSCCQVAQAAFTANDLYLGFTKSSAQADYIIDLGQPAPVGAGGSSVVNLSSYFSTTTFNSIFAGGADGVLVSVVAGSQIIGSQDVYATQVRTNGPGNPAIPGSVVTAGHSASQISGGASALSSMGPVLPSAGHGTNDSSKVYTAQVDDSTTALNFIGKTGVIPYGTFDSSAIMYLDLYKGTSAAGYVYLGYFTIDISSGTPNLSFTPLAAAVGPTAPVLNISRTGNTSTISFLSSSGTTYTLYGTNSAGLTAAVSTWPMLGTVSGDGTSKSFMDSTTESNRFYRVKAQ